MREDVALSGPEQHIFAYAFHREPTLPGDHGITLHAGSSRELDSHPGRDFIAA